MKDIALIGSRALKIRAPYLLNREPLDFDFICTRKACEEWVAKNRDAIKPKEEYWIDEDKKFILKGDSIVELEIAKPGTSSEMFLDLVKQSKPVETSFGLIPSLNLLFTLKKSHRYLKNSPHFFKTFQDFHKMKMVGATSKDFEDFLKLREKETYVFKTPKLNVKKHDFFSGDSIQYVYDHDSIHVSVCDEKLGKPAYTFYGVPGEEVKSSKKIFFEVDEHVRLRGGLEESYVLAIERSLVPHPGKATPRQAFMMAYSKVCSSITSGFFREYCYENGLKILDMYEDSYFDKFKQGIEKGIVKPFNANVAINPYK